MEALEFTYKKLKAKNPVNLCAVMYAHGTEVFNTYDARQLEDQQIEIDFTEPLKSANF